MLWWQEIKYIINWSNNITGTNQLLKQWAQENTLWLKISWNMQWGWKSDLTWQKSNFSDLSKFDLRTQIRKNAYNYIKSMTSWMEVWWVRYVVGNITLSWEQSYETLVVKDGNVTINWDLNLTWNRLWIIVLKDGYDIENWYSWSWNVYIKPQVTKINAIIYADGWVISVDDSWNVLATDNTSRTSKLQTQLVMTGSLFTRNTIWWSILGTTNKYILPGWKETTDFNHAMIYDLNYLRRWCSNNCGGNYFMINYNPKTQTNPPKLFSN
jgi:hypothetical protein